jgi:hypothetical protein
MSIFYFLIQLSLSLAAVASGNLPPTSGACVGDSKGIVQGLGACQMQWSQAVSELRKESQQSRQFCSANLGGAIIDRGEEDGISRCLLGYRQFYESLGEIEEGYRRDCGAAKGRLTKLSTTQGNERQCLERLANEVRSLATLQEGYEKRIRDIAKRLSRAKSEAKAAAERYGQDRERMERAVRNMEERIVEADQARARAELIASQANESQAGNHLQEAQRRTNEVQERRTLLVRGNAVQGNEIVMNAGEVTAGNGGATTITQYLNNVSRLRQEQETARKFAENGQTVMGQVADSFRTRATEYRSMAASLSASAGGLGQVPERRSDGPPTAASRAPSASPSGPGTGAQAPSTASAPKAEPSNGSTVTAPPAMPSLPSAGGGSGGGGTSPGASPFAPVAGPKELNSNYGVEGEQLGSKGAARDSPSARGGRGAEPISSGPLALPKPPGSAEEEILAGTAPLGTSGSAVEGVVGGRNNSSESGKGGKQASSSGASASAGASFAGGRGSLGGDVVPLGANEMNKARSDIMALAQEGGGANGSAFMEELPAEIPDLAPLAEDFSGASLGASVDSFQDPLTATSRGVAPLAKKNQNSNALGIDSVSLFQRVREAHIRSARGGRLLLGLKAKL